jgi:mRNA-degrading endonuclease RelE of RelBE toxin-antitoxin system
MLMVRRGECGALFIELKAGSGKPSAAQMDMHYRLRREGYRVVMIWDSVDEVMRAIEEYLAGVG